MGHYIVQVGPQGKDPSVCVLRDDFAERFGDRFRVPSDNPDMLAFWRVFENVVPSA